MAKRTYTDDEKRTALDLYKSHGPSAVHKTFGIPKSTVVSWAQKAGVRTVRTENARARVEAAQVDHAERRATIVSRLYSLTETNLALLENPAHYATMARDSEGAELKYLPGFIPAQDKQRELTALGIMIDKATKLEGIDNDQGANTATSMLDRLAHQLEGVPADVDPPGAGDDSGSGIPEAAGLPPEQP